MVTRNTIQYIKSLQRKKFRDKYQEFIVEGPKLVEELLDSRFSVSRIFTLKDYYEKLKARDTRGAELSIVSQSELDRISTLKTPNTMLAVAGIPKTPLYDLKLNDEYVFFLDGISDPGNLGTIIRTADWFGFRNIVCTSDCVDVYNPKVVQATMGSLFRSRIYYCNPKEYFTALDPAIPVYGTFLKGNNMYRESFANAGVVVIGSESHGIRQGTELFIKRRIYIPAADSHAESLNASVAAAIVCSEISRKRLGNI